MSVRRLTAIDMHGTRGTIRRRRLVLAEFVLGLIVAVALGTWLACSASSTGTRLLGAWMIGVGLNYAALTSYALTLTRPGALESELADVDTRRELGRYTIIQLWILVPCTLFAATAIRATSRRASDSLPASHIGTAVTTATVSHS